MKKQALWPFEFDPETIDELIVTDEMRKSLKEAIKNIPNMMLSGPPGTGKSSFVRILLKTTEYDYIHINASDENNIETVRSKIKGFATSLGTTEFKVVYLNEMDRLSGAAADMLKQLLEDVHEHTRFIFVCNHVEKVDNEIMSRCQHFIFSNPPAKDIFARCMHIIKSKEIVLENEQEFKKSLINTIKTLYPDIRRIINTLEKSTVDGKISSIDDVSRNKVYDEILEASIEKDFDEVRKLIRNNPIYWEALYQTFFENVQKFSSPADAVIEIAEYLYRHQFVSIKEINFLGMLMNMIKKGIIN